MPFSMKVFLKRMRIKPTRRIKRLNFPARVDGVRLLPSLYNRKSCSLGLRLAFEPIKTAPRTHALGIGGESTGHGMPTKIMTTVRSGLNYYNSSHSSQTSRSVAATGCTPASGNKSTAGSR